MNSDEAKYTGLIHGVLAEKGFVRKAAVGQSIYTASILKGRVSFCIELVLTDPFFGTKPQILLTEIPDELPITIPHLIGKRALCYLDETGVEFDRYDPESNIALVLHALDQLLSSYVESPELLREELLRELPVYWNRQISECIYLQGERTDQLTAVIYERENLHGQHYDEIVLSDSPSQADAWISKRNGETKSTHIKSGFILEIPDNAPIDLNAWPPASLNQALVWIKSIGTDTYQRFVDKIFSILSAEKYCFVVARLKMMHMGFVIKLDTSARSKLLSKYSEPSKQRKPKKKGGGLSRRKKLSLLSQVASFTKQDYYRTTVFDTRSIAVVQRNLGSKVNLSGKKILLIGCGTLGGYTAELLRQAGAGVGGGQLILADPDELHPENLGRHVLGTEYLGELKSQAVKHYIQRQSPGDTSIAAVTQSLNPHTVTTEFDDVDLYIDTTGDIHFSTNFCHALRKAASRIPTIYCWVDAGGMASRALLDRCDTAQACYRCLKISDASGELMERFALFRPDAELPTWKPNPCGVGSYLPYSSQASVSAAGLVQSMAIDWANGITSPRFRHIGFDERVLRTKNGDPKASKGCPCCQA